MRDADEFIFPTKTLADCQQLAQRIARAVETPLTIALNGTLGAGKTQFVRFFVEHLGGNPEDVTSPTFVLLQSYEAHYPIHHIDAYRIHDDDEFYGLGVEELFETQSIVLVEWAERVISCLPEERLEMSWQIQSNSVSGDPHSKDGYRSVRLRGFGPPALALIQRIRAS